MAKWRYLIVEPRDGKWWDGKATVVHPQKGQRVTLEELGQQGWEAVGFTATDLLLLKQSVEEEDAEVDRIEHQLGQLD